MSNPATARFEEWKRFNEKDEILTSHVISQEVRESWIRSKSYGVNPYASGFTTISSEELQKKRDQKAELRKIATPYMNHLYEIIKGSGSIIILADEEGVIIDVASDEAGKSHKNFPVAGSVQSEKTVGTNGVGTSLVCDSPIQIRGAEHWFKDNHSWTCNASTIHFNGKIAGCLNLSTPSQDDNPLSLGLIVSAVNAIERELELRNSLNDVQMLMKKQETILKIMKDGIILISHDGTVIQDNSRVHEILEDSRNWYGKHIKEVLNCSIDFQEILKNKIILDSHETGVRIQNKHNHLLLTTAPIENRDSPGALAILVQESKSMMKIVNKMSGSKAHYHFKDIIGQSKEIRDCIAQAQQISQYDSNVLIMGESGTGKELFAQSIHNSSTRRDMPFVALNCGALSRELIQSELFGYEGGAYTGAKSNGNPGKFELANGGTIFLDEIGELPLEMQANLLRVLQTGEVNRIGSKHTISVDVKVITATNKDLYKAVNDRTFRKDLFYRINLFTIELPSLRARKGDIRLLTDYFLKIFSQKTGKERLIMHENAYSHLEAYSWPGNIRQLENIMERTITMADEGIIQPEDFPAEIIKSITGKQSIQNPSGKSESLDLMEKQHLERLLRETKGNLREVAKRLNIARSTVYRKIQKYGLEIEDFR